MPQFPTVLVFLLVVKREVLGAIAIELATKHPDLAGLITEGAFTSIQDMAHFIPGIKIFPLSLLITQRFDSITKIKSLQTPILILHGAAIAQFPR
ncbi:MAG: hypothetical protein HC939_12515 [Pleurocapsa sp. SU_5_0]|nr:hypothetical protein [Pleurocapsa sp. SU_5_0]NJO96901.1 hypothetical protein [Pleurocapsa sp. CRU_1_2]NJR47570.1 hypothetical protein [Hyellaceae cyanobacterium CSU_1_1]